ncbi:MAG: MarR family transcriptional regulator [Pelosinus sp.]|nr:MarR family transcriptional regulator [Pelosinus sp.]
MVSNAELYDFILDNIQKIMIPEEFNAIGLSISRLELLALSLVARQDEPMTMSNLAQAMAVPMSTATGIADRLVKKGLLKRGGLPQDRRIVTVSLTGTGCELVHDLQKNIHSFLNRIRAVLSDEEFQQAIGLVKKVISGLQTEKNMSDQALAQRKKITVE